MTQEEYDKDMIESIEMWLHECEPQYVEKELAWLNELRTRLLEEESEKHVPNSLEEASDKYAEKHGFRVPYDGSDNFYDDVDVKASKEGFIAGAKWQKKQDDNELSDLLTIAHLQGADQMKEQMLKEAVAEVEVGMRGDPIEIILDKYVQRAMGIFPGDKVRLIVLPKED